MGDVERPAGLLKPLETPWRTLTGPGPSNLSPRVQASLNFPVMGNPLQSHHVTTVMNDVKEGIKYFFQTRNKITFPVSATGNGAKEAAVANLLEPGEVALVACNGFWGDRFAAIAERYDVVVKKITKPLGEVFTYEEIEKALDEHKPAVLYVTHGESVGCTIQPIEKLGPMCHKRGALLVVDGCATVGAVPIYMDRWEIDCLYSGGQKVLSAVAGSSPISFSPAAWEKIQKRKTKVRCFYFDVALLAAMWQCDPSLTKLYHHSALWTNLYSFREALAIIAEEGLEHAWARQKDCTAALHKGLTDLGIGFLVKDPAARCPTVTGALVPKDMDALQVPAYMLENYKMEMSTGLHPKEGVWRLRLMGFNTHHGTVVAFLAALKDALEKVRAGVAGVEGKQEETFNWGEKK